MPRSAPDIPGALVALASHGVDFIVVGGVAGVLGGAPISTWDVDVVHRRERENVERLITALTAMDARYRDPAGRILRPSLEGLIGSGHHLLETRYGAVDVLGQISDGAGYNELLPDTVEYDVLQHTLRVLGLPRLIAEKERLGRDKDRAVLAILRRTLEESR